MSGLHRVLDGAVVQVHLDHVAARRLHGLLDGNRDLAGLAAAEADLAVAVADNRQGGETEDTATLDHFRHAVDLDQLLLEVAFLLLLFLIVKSHISTLEFQSTFTGGVGQGLDASVVLVASAIEGHLVDTGGFCTLGDQLAHGCGSFNIAGLAAAQIAIKGRGAGQYLVACGRDDLGVDMPGSTVHAQAIDTEATHTGASAAGATQP